MRFLFINPNRSIVKNNIWSVVNSVMPPLGLATLAAILECEGAEVDIIDAAALNFNDADLARDLAKRAPYDFIGLTATTPEIDNAIDVSRLVRQTFPAAQIILGGVHATIFHEDLLRQGVCDLAVRGEGEPVVIGLARKQSKAAIARRNICGGGSKSWQFQ